MNKNELEFEKANLKARQFDQIISLIKHVISVSGTVFALWILVSGLQSIISGQSPESIKAISELVHAFPISDILGYAWGAGMTGIWMVERRQKKRAIKKKGEYQAAAERGEVNRTSSNLTETGDTPVEDKT